ncbi:phage scaffolding protein [Hathewaya histolytica]|uniref:phage scaffolding protein n=1 Tax=Hathewaya histolytica TaxID=1498 RepID=UPI003B6832FD
MDFKEFLKNQGLSDEQINKILSGMKENKIYTTSEENMEERYNKLKEQKEDLENQLGTANTALEELKKSNKGNEELQVKIKQYETDLEALKTESEFKIRNLTIDSAIKGLLKDNKAKYEDLLISKFDKEKLVIKDDGTIEGLEDQFKGIKEGYKDLFEQQITGTKPFDNGASNSTLTGVEAMFYEMNPNLK